MIPVTLMLVVGDGEWRNWRNWRNQRE